MVRLKKYFRDAQFQFLSGMEFIEEIKPHTKKSSHLLNFHYKID